MRHSSQLAYIIGIALGDGNLSNPNGKATRLRITCSSLYPEITDEICVTLKYLFPNNKVSVVNGPKASYFNISVYSNKLNSVMPWQAGKGSKHAQNAHVPEWILQNELFTRECLRGLIQTDGSIYVDRVYKMINFTNIIESLVDDVFTMISSLGYTPHKYKSMQKSGLYKFTIRLSKHTDAFLKEINLTKRVVT